MSKYTEIYGDEFGTLFVGVAPEGKILDIHATERGMQIDLDDAEPASKILREHFNRPLSREEVVAILGEGPVDKVEAENCEYTGRVSADLDCSNEVEFSATYAIKDEDPEWGFIAITAYYYQDKDAAAETEDLGNLDWEVRHFALS